MHHAPLPWLDLQGAELAAQSLDSASRHADIRRLDDLRIDTASGPRRGPSTSTITITTTLPPAAHSSLPSSSHPHAQRMIPHSHRTHCFFSRFYLIRRFDNLLKSFLPYFLPHTLPSPRSPTQCNPKAGRLHQSSCTPPATITVGEYVGLACSSNVVRLTRLDRRTEMHKSGGPWRFCACMHV